MRRVISHLHETHEVNDVHINKNLVQLEQQILYSLVQNGLHNEENKAYQFEYRTKSMKHVREIRPAYLRRQSELTNCWTKHRGNISRLPAVYNIVRETESECVT